MAILTKSKLSRIADSKAGYTPKSVILNEARSFNSKQSAKTSIFLSHSHHDSDYVKDVVVLLRKMGVNVYIDWMDDSMPKETSGQTAALLKQKIKENDKFIFLATNKSIESKMV
jgi:metal-dependent hydrolase (beta-lactamase superfamily II)